jgi:hypothetical protein
MATKKKASFLENKTVRLMPILKDGGMNPKGHDGEFMYSGTIVRFVVPLNVRKARLEDPLTREEKMFFEDDLDEDLNIHKKKDNYWKKFEIVIRKDDKLMNDGFEMNLEDSIDYLRYKVLLIQPNVAPSWEERFDRGEYMFALVDDSAQVNEDAAKVDRKKDAYIFLSKVESSRDKMLSFLKVFGKRQAGNATVEFLKSEINKIIEDPINLNRMTALITDDDYDVMLFIEEAVECGAIRFSNKKYTLPGGDYLNQNNPYLGGTIEAINKLKAATDEVYLTISTQIKESK